jgi:outer membrane protein assembly factor BamB
LRRLAADGTESWSVDLGPAQAQGDLPVPAVAADGGITVGTVDGPVCVSADGKVLAGDTTSGLAPLRLSACSGGSVFVLTSEGLVVYPGQAGPYEVPVAGMDEVVPGGPGPLVFPELQRALLQTGAARVALVSTGDAPGEIWSSVLPPGAGEISGMGADRNGRAYVVAGNGVVLTYDVHADDRSLRFAWAPSTSPGATVAAGPLLPEAGVVLVGGPDGVWQIRWPEKMPELLAAPAGATTALIALRLGGLAAVRSRPDGTSVLEFAVAAGSLPEPRDAAGGTVVRRMELPCAAPQASAPQEQGMMAVACGDTLLGIVAPETRQRDAPWPMQRGAGNSGCVE